MYIPWDELFVVYTSNEQGILINYVNKSDYILLLKEIYIFI